MSVAVAAPARSGAPSGGGLHQPDSTLAALPEAGPATRSAPRIPTRTQGDELLELTARPLDPGFKPDSGDPSTATIACELADIRPRRVAAVPQQALTSEVRPLGIAGTAIPGAPLPAACQAALHSLLARYTAIASRLTREPHPNHDHIPAHATVSDHLEPCHVTDSYLEDILFFRRFSRPEIAALRDGLRVASAPRGTRIDTRSALWIVLRGAVETSVRRGAFSCRVRVAGPGRCLGHLSLIAGQKPNPELILEAVLRERAVLLEIPVQRAKTLHDRDARAHRRFTQALTEDIAKALHDADGPLAQRIDSDPALSAAPLKPNRHTPEGDSHPESPTQERRDRPPNPVTYSNMSRKALSTTIIAVPRRVTAHDRSAVPSAAAGNIRRSFSMLPSP